MMEKKREIEKVRREIIIEVNIRKGRLHNKQIGVRKIR